MIRSDAIARLQSYLQTAYDGPITPLAQEDDGDLTPPCAVVRIGSGENMGFDQAVLWDFNVVVAVFHDADDTTIETAESQAEDMFAELCDIEAVTAYIESGGFLVSTWLPLTSEAGREDTKWMHFHSFQLIIAPDPA